MGVEMWADMDPDGDPLASAMAARDLVKRLTTAAWHEHSQPGDGSTG
jgi:hypothetical protein